MSMNDLSRHVRLISSGLLCLGLVASGCGGQASDADLGSTSSQTVTGSASTEGSSAGSTSTSVTAGGSGSSTSGNDRQQPVPNERYGAPERADADAWPEDYEDVEVGTWYQATMELTFCGPPFFRGLPSRPFGVVYRELTFYTSSVMSLPAFDEEGNLPGVARINRDGDLEFTTDRATDVTSFEALPRSDFTEDDLACE